MNYKITEKEIVDIREKLSRILRNNSKLEEANVFHDKCKTRVKIIQESATHIDEIMKKLI